MAKVDVTPEARHGIPAGVKLTPMMRQYAMAKAEDASTPVAAGEMEIRAQVRLTVAIK